MMQHGSAIRDLETDEVRSGLQAGTIALVDVREPHEVAAGIIPGSIVMPLSQFDPSSLPVGDGRRIVFSCAAGIRSRVAVEACRRAGLDCHEHYVGGYKGWVAAGEAVVPGPA
ncbi:rhodanese-like domain-containing protein [uncultured Enterovirga sp.]|uniref:rhodanese-like domain-containing protein n=1 Tax=uncultured Enterovirga sp. TaxID=2026352 RepID=UPI0035CAA1BE